MNEPTTTGFYFAKPWPASPWTIVFVYASGDWTGVWHSDAHQGVLSDMSEWGEKVKMPEEQPHEYPVEPGSQPRLPDTREVQS